MTMVLLTALGVGGATVIGAIIGFIFKNISHKFTKGSEQLVTKTKQPDKIK